MKISMFATIIFLISLFLAPLNAQENEEKQSCSEVYDICGAKCETLEIGFDKCVDKCDAEYDKCSEKEESK